MPAHPWQLRCDTGPLVAAAEQWVALADALTEAADELVRSSRRVRDHGWESGTAEVYDGHRKQVVGGLDTVAGAAREVGRVLADVAGTLGTAQRRLDREWSAVALVPHTTVGAQQVLVFREDSDDQRGQVQRATRTAESIRSDLDASVAGLAGRLRTAHVELQRAADTAIAGSTGSGAGGGIAALAERIGAAAAEDLRADPGTARRSSSSVAGGLDDGAAYAGSLPPTAFTAPRLADPGDLGSLAGGIGGGLAGGALAGLGGRRRRDRPAEQGHAPVAPGAATGRAGAAAGRVGGRAGGRQSAPGGSGRPGAAGSRSVVPTETDAEAEARLAREQQEGRAAKRLVVQERRAARAARRAGRDGVDEPGEAGATASADRPRAAGAADGVTG